MFGRLGGALRDTLELPALVWRRSKHTEDDSRVANPHLRGLSISRCKQQVSSPLAWTELISACIPTCVPLPGCCSGDPLSGQVKKINALWASALGLQLFLLPELTRTKALEKPGCATRQKHQHFPLKLPLVIQTLQNHWSSCCTWCGATLKGHTAYRRACSSWLDFRKCISKAETVLFVTAARNVNESHPQHCACTNQLHRSKQ